MDAPNEFKNYYLRGSRVKEELIKIHIRQFPLITYSNSNQ